MTLDRMKAGFPGQRVARFSNVRIAVAVCTRSEHCVGLIMALRCMCAIIMDQNKIKRLFLELHFLDQASPVIVRGVLKPLERLYGVPQVSVQSKGVSAPTLRSLEHSIKSAQLKLNVLSYTHQMGQEFRSARDIRRNDSLHMSNLATVLLAMERATQARLSHNQDWDEYLERDVDEAAFVKEATILEKDLRNLTREKLTKKVDEFRTYAKMHELPHSLVSTYEANVRKYRAARESRVAVVKERFC